jgi:adenylate cyclase
LTINFYNRGPSQDIPMIRAYDLLEGNVQPEQIRDKLVVIGSDTNLLHDYLQTPFGSLWGTEVVALSISNILNGDYLYRPPWAGTAEILLMLVALILITIVALNAKPTWSLTITIVVLGTIFSITAWAYVQQGQLLGVTLPVSFSLIVYLQHTLLRYVREERQKRTLKNALSLYLSPELSRQVADNPELLGLQGREEVLTVLFTDIRNFSSISETMGPEELTSFLQRYFSPMTDIIFEAGGTLDKYIGDAIMAFWGAPLPQVDHPQRACAAALKMLWALDELAGGDKEGLPPEIGMGIGIHTGSMRVGNMGSEKRLNYTVLGDNVNLGSRLEGLTKHYGIRLIVSEATWNAVKTEFYGRCLDTVRVKGKDEAVTIYEVRGHGKPLPEEQSRLDSWDSAMNAFITKDWEAARTGLTAWHDRGDTPAGLYLERIEDYSTNGLPGSWPPVTTMTEK